MKVLSYISAVVVFVAFLYTGLVAAIYLAKFIFDFSGESAGMRVAVLMLYMITLEALAIVYRKLPYKPQTKLFRWLERLSLFKDDNARGVADIVGVSPKQKVD